MEIKLGDRGFQIPDQCPGESPRRGTLKRNLKEHGPEAFLVSTKLKSFAGCVIEDLRKAGAEVVDQQPATQSAEEST